MNSTPDNLQHPHLAYRPDIDGLRALAIIAVVVYHAFPHFLRGGFIGVDVFFVISGYLITSIIIKDHLRARFSLAEFYRRRIKRIFPSLIVVLGFCLLAGWYLMLAGEFQLLGKHVAAGAGYVSNLILVNESGYFDVSSELKPLLHLWSLSIEEQFYLVWPLLLMLAFRFNFNLLALIVLNLVISFVLNVAYIKKFPVEVFYIPVFRAWELLIGATLSYINLYRRHALDHALVRLLFANHTDGLRRLENGLGGLGFFLVLVSMFALNRSKVFPGWWALLPTLGAVLLIAAGSQAWLNRKLLSSRTMIFIGQISYPLYLWHWPLLSFAHLATANTPGVWVRLSAIACSVLLAWLSYALVEKHLRFNLHWTVAPGLFMVLLAVGACGIQVYRQDGYVDRYPREEAVFRNVGALAWDTQGLNHQDACTNKFGQAFSQYCEIQDIRQAPSVLLVGDSNANHFYPGLAQVYARRHEDLLNLGEGGCAPFFGVNTRMAEGDLHCANTIDRALDFAMRTRSIKTVVLSLMGTGYALGSRDLSHNEDMFITLSYAKNPRLTRPLEILEAGMRDTLSRLTRADKQVVFIISIPMLDFDPASCVNDRPVRLGAVHLKSPCALPKRKEDQLSGAYRQMVSRVLRDFPQVKLWDSDRVLCDSQNCWAMKDGMLLYRDSVHLSQAGSRYVAERLAAP